MRGNNGILVPIFIIILSLLTDWYVLQGLKTIILPIRQPGIRQAIIILFRIFSIGVIVGTIIGGYFVMVKGEFTLMFRIFMHIFLIYFTAKIAFILFLSFEDIVRLFRGTISLISSGTLGSFLPPRSFGVSVAGLSVSLLVIGVFMYGMFFERSNYKVSRKTIYSDKLPAAFDGTTIAQISDFHAGSFHNRDEVIKGIEIIKDLKPDIFVFTGDMVNNLAKEAVPWIPVLRDIQAPLGKFSVIGNHDYGDYVRWKNQEAKDANLAQLVRHEQQAGFDVLINEHRAIVKGSDTIYVAGVENWGHNFIRQGDLPKSLNGLSDKDFIVLLSHDPSHWDWQVKTYPVPVALTLSGHTHGFQFGIEWGKFKWSPGQYLYPNWSGLTEENGKYLYVNQGFGYIAFEGRIGMPPEITLITLKRR
ncbi:MAG TPA: metallophosphoesterase [Bacteroidales bacterium]|nr:metallophosphoesterase [Bacteroidales bacterium]